MKIIFAVVLFAAAATACEKEKEVTIVSLNKTTFTLVEGASEKLTATIGPKDAINQELKWNSNNKAAAIVDASGNVTAVKAGIATITATAANGISGSATVTVTALITAPVLSAGSVKRTCDVSATVSFTTDKAGTAYYLVLTGGAAAPTAAAVKAGTSLGAAAEGANANKAVTLSAGAKDIYVVVEDATGAISAPLKIVAAAPVVVVLFDGKGTAQEPYEIPNAEKLAKMRDLINAGNATYAAAGVHFQLTDNIALSGNWTPIGDNNTNTASSRFRGQFDGNGKTISNLTIARTENYNGLFGYVVGGTIKNLGLTDVDITITGSGICTGSLAGVMIGCSSAIANCYVSGTINGGNFTAGIVGQMDGSITNCYVSASVKGMVNVGGIAGLVYGEISNCYTTGAVKGSDLVGGIAGYLNTDASLTGCAALNPCITRNAGSTSDVFGRVAGGFYSEGALAGNVAFNGMTAAGGADFGSGAHDDKDGAAIKATAAKTKSTYSASPRSWAFGANEDNPWRWGLSNSYQLPTLWWQTEAPDMEGHL